MSFSIGENIGPYRISEQLGQGGMATVYKAYHAALDRYVALKVLHPAFNEDKSFELRFQREARVVAKLEHPNIVPIYDYAEHEHRPYLVMKFIEGETLKARLQRGPLSAGEIQRVVDSVGAALSYAHTQGILHRDIKPSNVMLDSSTIPARVVLTDFGIAKIIDSQTLMTNTNILGTLDYIAPEQIQASAEVDSRADIYALGIMTYQMLTGCLPFESLNTGALLLAHLNAPPPDIRLLIRDLPRHVAHNIQRAMAKNPAARHATAGEFVASLENE